MHADQLRGARRSLRDDPRQLRQDDHLRYLLGAALVRRRRYAERLRLHPEELRRPAGRLRNDLRSMRIDAGMRRLHAAEHLRRRGCSECLRLRGERRRVLCAPRNQLRVGHWCRRLRQAPQRRIVRELQGSGELRWSRRAERLRLRAGELRLSG